MCTSVNPFRGLTPVILANIDYPQDYRQSVRIYFLSGTVSSHPGMSQMISFVFMLTWHCIIFLTAERKLYSVYFLNKKAKNCSPRLSPPMLRFLLLFFSLDGIINSRRIHCSNDFSAICPKYSETESEVPI